MQVTDVLQSNTHAHCRARARQKRLYATVQTSAVVPVYTVTGNWLGGEPGCLGTWALGRGKVTGVMGR